MDVTCLTPILNVSDMAASFDWFEKLGWRKLWDWGSPPTFGAVGSGQVEIFLCLGAQGSRGGPLPRHATDDTGGVWISWFLGRPADVDAAHALALQHGMTVTHPPRRTGPTGGRGSRPTSVRCASSAATSSAGTSRSGRTWRRRTGSMRRSSPA